MALYDFSKIPDAYIRPAPEGHRGMIRAATYPVRNYISSARKLITNQKINAEEIGREAVEGPPIMKSCNIYFPTGFDPNNTQVRYPVLYLLHGVGGSEDEWLGQNEESGGNAIISNMVDHLIYAGEIEPLIIVFPNGRSAHDWQDRTFNTEGTHLLGFYYFDFELRHDLIPFIESTYPTRADIHDTSAAAIEYNRRQRAIAGLSMGGMQCLNLIVGGYRHDSVVYTGSTSRWGNGLAPTVPAPGMVDLFSKVGAFSPARTTSDGTVIGSRLAASPYKLEWLYMNCGDADDISYQPFEEVRQTLMKAAGDRIEHFRHALIQDGVHDFNIWFLGAYQFIQQAFRKNT